MGYDKRKLKFWVSGVSISLLGVSIIRFKLLSLFGMDGAVVDIIGLILAFSGLFIITLATRKKSGYSKNI